MGMESVGLDCGGHLLRHLFSQKGHPKGWPFCYSNPRRHSASDWSSHLYPRFSGSWPRLTLAIFLPVFSACIARLSPDNQRLDRLRWP